MINRQPGEDIKNLVVIKEEVELNPVFYFLFGVVAAVFPRCFHQN
ncbi:MAG: hypothetical protein ACYTXL_07675 [Nostoc sp.]